MCSLRDLLRDLEIQSAASSFQSVDFTVIAQCQDPELANDIVQTMFLKAISQIEGFRGECKLTAWLCQIARNEWLNHCRKMKRQVSLEGYLETHGEETLRTEDDILNGIIKEQEARQVRKA